MANQLPTERLKAIAIELDSIIPKMRAELRTVQYGGGPDESYMQGTREGYLRFATELLKSAAAFEPGQGREPHLDLDSSVIMNEQSDTWIEWFEVCEPTLEPPYLKEGRYPLKSRVVTALMMVVTFLLLLFSVVGGVVVIRWLFVRT